MPLFKPLCQIPQLDPDNLLQILAAEQVEIIVSSIRFKIPANACARILHAPQSPIQPLALPTAAVSADWQIAGHNQNCILKVHSAALPSVSSPSSKPAEYVNVRWLFNFIEQDDYKVFVEPFPSAVRLLRIRHSRGPISRHSAVP